LNGTKLIEKPYEVQPNFLASALPACTGNPTHGGSQTISFKTKEGQSWTLPVADGELLKKQICAKETRSA
jgi:hypothetical protein